MSKILKISKTAIFKTLKFENQLNFAKIIAKNLAKLKNRHFGNQQKFKNQLVRNQVNHSPGTDQPKIRLARQLPKLRSGKTFWRQCKYRVSHSALVFSKR